MDGLVKERDESEAAYRYKSRERRGEQAQMEIGDAAELTTNLALSSFMQQPAAETISREQIHARSPLGRPLLGSKGGV